jgi:hypothetical protein
VVPACADAVKLPLPVEKEYALYLDDKLVRVVTGRAAPERGWLKLKGNGPGRRVLALECASMAPGFGLTGPVVFRCKFLATELRPWSEMGLWWYSGRALYRKRFEATPGDLKHGSIRLNLGEVRECAEVWVNGTLAGTRIWPPYCLDIKPFLKRGDNEIVLVVSNLPANRYAWDVWGSRGGGGTLVSGLLGPVTLECYGRESQPTLNGQTPGSPPSGRTRRTPGKR